MPDLQSGDEHLEVDENNDQTQHSESDIQTQEAEPKYEEIAIPFYNRSIYISLNPEILLRQVNLVNLFSRLMVLCIDWSREGWSRPNMEAKLQELGFPEKYARAIGVGFRMYMQDLTCRFNGEAEYNGDDYIVRKMSTILEDYKPLVKDTVEG